jgi:hypothetical protein
VAIADVNGDTHPDLAVANAFTDDVSVLLGDGTGAFGPATSFAAGDLPQALTVSDLNGDGNLDLAVADGNTGNVSVLLGFGTGSFAPAQTFAAGGSPEDVHAADLNRDGRADLVFANYFSSGVSVLLNTTRGTLAVPVDVRPDQCPNRLDLSSQEDLAVAVAGTPDFDPRLVDPASVRLAGVAPLRSTITDTTLPYSPYLGKRTRRDCTLGHPDGIADLKLKFSIPDLARALGSVSGTRVLHLTGSLRNGTPIAGEDVVVVR